MPCWIRAVVCLIQHPVSPMLWVPRGLLWSCGRDARLLCQAKWSGVPLLGRHARGAVAPLCSLQLHACKTTLMEKREPVPMGNGGVINLCLNVRRSALRKKQTPSSQSGPTQLLYATLVRQLCPRRHRPAALKQDVLLVSLHRASVLTQGRKEITFSASHSMELTFAVLYGH